MSHRFYCATFEADSEVEIAGPEAHHLLHVMRSQIGDTITLFDGQGHQANASIASKSKSAVVCRVAAVEARGCERAAPLTLAVALPKGDRQKWLVEKLTELGVTQLVPLATERSNPLPSTSALEKLRRAVIESCKQCERNRLMEIAPPHSIGEVLVDFHAASHRYIAHPGADNWQPGRGQGDTCVLIGPEGGFTDDELHAASSAGWQAASLAPAILRIETAAVAAAAILGPR